MTADAIAALVLSWVTRELPPEKYSRAPRYPEAAETVEERTARYREFAGDVAQVLEEELPAAARRPMAALLVAVAIRESGLAKDVDAPSCSPTRVRGGGCDGGRAKSVWQVQQAEPFATRRDAAREALRRVRRSLSACRSLPAESRLAAYAAGVCGSSAGQRLSRDRFTLARKLLAQ